MTVGANELSLTPIDLAPESDGRTEPPTAALVRRARAGDARAFEALVERHERMVLRTALRFLGRLDRAQDAAQEAFLRLHKYLGRFDESRELGPWLYRTVVNACHDLARRSSSARLVPLEDVREAEQATARGGPEEIEAEVSRAEERRLVQAALITLPEKERAAIVLRDIEGRPTAEVARILGSSEGTVRSQVSTGRLKIKRFVERHREGRS
jgi:RNA polymerase sigma-70 factor, ECF subfamily